MCGFAGLFSKDLNKNALLEITNNMSKALFHRGPDDCGNWIDENLGLSISHQRLSILDLSNSGRQPMISHNKRFIIAFNGEIYNHFDIRTELKNNFKINNWKSHSDTEVLLESIAVYGLRKTLTKIVGMFAFSLFDKEKNKLYLVRDRFGEKPLYYGYINNLYSRSFCFASEVIAFKSNPHFNRKINNRSFIQYSQFGYLSSPNCIYENIFQIKPGHLLEINLNKPYRNFNQEQWWSLLSIAKKSFKNKYYSPDEAIENLEFALNRATREQSIADVQIGSFLSGGVDSSLIASLLNKNNLINTFTIGFEDQNFDESRFAKLISDYLKTNHFESILRKEDLIDIIPRLPIIYSEPFADSSQIPTYLVCREARKMGLKVCLTGDGADEIFGGYNRYLWSNKIWDYVSWLPYNLRFLLSIILRKIPYRFFNLIGRLLYIDKCHHKLIKLADRLKYIKDIDDLYLSLISIFPDHKLAINESFISTLNISNINPSKEIKNFFENGLEDINIMMLADSIGYLPNDILTKVDRASMAVGLETRAPFLDHRVLEIALALPESLKINPKIKFGTKLALRKILNKYIPNSLIDRPKTGFGIPIGSWLKTNLKDWSYEMINNSSSYYDKRYTHQLLYEHNYKNFDHTEKLWTILMWESWFKAHG